MTGWERWLLDFLAGDVLIVFVLTVAVVGAGAGRELLLWIRERTNTRRVARLDRAIADRMRREALR